MSEERPFIFESLLDVDFYKFTMWNFIMEYYAGTHVLYGTKNRTKGLNLVDHIEEKELRRQLDHVMSLKFKKDEIDIIPGGEKYRDFLLGYSPSQYDLEYRKDGFRLESSGPWEESIFWETISMGINTELYGDSKTRHLSKKEKEQFLAQALNKLYEKLKYFKKYPGLRIAEFGTRRRFSREHQENCVQMMADVLGDQFVGTSNVYLAKKYGLKPIGTMAHELFMVVAGLMGDTDEGLRASQRKVLEQWWNLYGRQYSIALSDTFGSDVFFDDFTVDFMEKSLGTRQDSGNPFEYGEKKIRRYNKNGVNPKDKFCMFSDGLNPKKVVNLYIHFKDRFIPGFGMGTNITNDMPIDCSFSIVMKALFADGRPLVKLSDNLAKATGPEVEVNRYKRVFGYENQYKETCIY